MNINNNQSTVEDLSLLEIKKLNNYDKIDGMLWHKVLTYFSSIQHYQYKQIDNVKDILGFTLCKLKDNSWNLWFIKLDIKTGLYSLKSTGIPGSNDLTEVVMNNFIFCINGELYEYVAKNNKEDCLKMSKDLLFQITRLTIIDELSKENALKKYRK
jgi:hypothetical protein